MARRRRSEVRKKESGIKRVDVESRQFKVVTLEDWEQANDAGADLLQPGCFIYLDVPADTNRSVIEAARRQLLEQGALAVSVRREAVDAAVPEKATHGSSMSHELQDARPIALELVRKSRASKEVKKLATEVVEKALSEVGL